MPSSQYSWKEFALLSRMIKRDQARFIGDGSDEVNEETINRVVISRSYYAALISARQWLFNNSTFRLNKNEKDPHSRIISELSSSSEPSVKRLSYQITNLRTRRREADYEEIGSSINSATAEDSINQAIRICEILENI